MCFLSQCIAVSLSLKLICNLKPYHHILYHTLGKGQLCQSWIHKLCNLMTDSEISWCENEAAKHLYESLIPGLKKLLYSLKNVIRSANLLWNSTLWHLLCWKYEGLKFENSWFSEASLRDLRVVQQWHAEEVWCDVLISARSTSCTISDNLWQ